MDTRKEDGEMREGKGGEGKRRGLSRGNNEQ